MNIKTSFGQVVDYANHPQVAILHDEQMSVIVIQKSEIPELIRALEAHLTMREADVSKIEACPVAGDDCNDPTCPFCN